MTAASEIRRWLLLGRKAMANLDNVLKSRDITLLTKVFIVMAMVFPVVMYGLWKLNYKEGREPKNWCLWTVMLDKTPGIPLDGKEIKQVSLKRNQPWIFVGRSDVEAEASVFWSWDASRCLIGKVSDVWKDWVQKKRASEDEMAGWHHRCDGHKLGLTSGDSEAQRGLVCCSPWGHKEVILDWVIKVRLDWVTEQQHS